MITQVGIVSSTNSTKKRPINIQEWLYWQWRYEQWEAKQRAIPGYPEEVLEFARRISILAQKVGS